MRIFLWIFALFSVYAGISEATRLPVFFLPASAFTRAAGQVVEVKLAIDRTPGHATSVQTTTSVYAVHFSYLTRPVARVADSLSPACSYCEREDVARITERQPDALHKGAPVTVYFRTADPNQAYLELPRRQDMWHQLWMTLLWLVIGPAVAFLFIKALADAKSNSNEESQA